jgi:hypothetical protein
LLEGLRWESGVKAWTIRLRITIASSSEYVPSSTDWIVHASPDYPLGQLKFYPARDKGITVTFQHQAYNMVDPSLRWRIGALCLERPEAQVGRHLNDEPRTATERLSWHAWRAREWIEAAATGTLVRDGEPFELPQFPEINEPPVVAFSDGPENFHAWLAAPEHGFAELVAIGPETVALRRWLDLASKPIMSPSWGNRVQISTPFAISGWLRIEAPPCLPPWQGPLTWGELRQATATAGTKIDSLVKPLLPKLRGDQEGLLLVGFPIPNVSGAKPSEFHWQALLLPALPRRGNIPHGFRDNEIGLWMRDRQKAFGDHLPIRWRKVQNWNPQRLLARGHLDVTTQTTAFALIGAGALGSALGAQLVRGGTRAVLVVDGDDLRAANLVRHELTLNYVGRNKADALATHLNELSPHATVQSHPGFLATDPHDVTTLLEPFRVVLDCTASDQVLGGLARSSWTRPKLFVSISLALAGKRLIFFAAHGSSFPFSEFQTLTSPWSQTSTGDDTPVWEGPGCWNPLFPARQDDVILATATASKLIELYVRDSPARPQVHVFDQRFEGTTFSGFHRVNLATT